MNGRLGVALATLVLSAGCGITTDPGVPLDGTVTVEDVPGTAEVAEVPGEVPRPTDVPDEIQQAGRTWSVHCRLEGDCGEGFYGSTEWCAPATLSAADVVLRMEHSDQAVQGCSWGGYCQCDADDMHQPCVPSAAAAAPARMRWSGVRCGDWPDIPDEWDACVADCTGRKCGDDRCGGSCGNCADTDVCTAEGHCQTIDCEQRTCGPNGQGGTCPPGCADDQACDVSSGTCLVACDDAAYRASLTWGPAALVSRLEVPSEAEAVQGSCFDYTGDGLGDNGVRGLAGQVNGPLADLADGVGVGLVLEMEGLEALPGPVPFRLALLSSVPAPAEQSPEGGALAQPEGYDWATCQPRRTLAATLWDPQLSAGPDRLEVRIPLGGPLELVVLLLQVHLSGTVTAGEAGGFSVSGGTVSGVVTKQQLSAELDRLQKACDQFPSDAKPDFCSYLTVSTSATALMFDLHQVRDADGRLAGFIPKSKDALGDAGSICLSFDAIPTTIVGLSP